MFQENNDYDGTNTIWIIIVVVIATTALFVILYSKYKDMKRESMEKKENNVAKEGHLALKNHFLLPDGTLDESKVQVDWPGIHAEESGTKSESGADAERLPLVQRTSTKGVGGTKSEGGTKGEGGGTENKNVVKQVTKLIKSGKLLKMINRFHSRANDISDKVEKKMAAKREEKETEEERKERKEQEKYEKLADAAVNPLFPLRMKQLKKQQQEERVKDKEKEHQQVEAMMNVLGNVNTSNNDLHKKYNYNQDQLKILKESMAAA